MAEACLLKFTFERVVLSQRQLEKGQIWFRGIHSTRSPKIRAAGWRFRSAATQHQGKPRRSGVPLIASAIEYLRAMPNRERLSFLREFAS
jgi:hypothetical protein